MIYKNRLNSVAFGDPHGRTSDKMTSITFFFSYASQTHQTSIWRRWDKSGNHLDDFYTALCNRIASLAAADSTEVAFRDTERLALSDFWGPRLVAGLQEAPVLVSVISPHYLKSVPCGREVMFFHRRFEALGRGERHYILPVFWEGLTDCRHCMNKKQEQFLHALQQKQKDMPANYPHTGLYHFYNQEEWSAVNRVIDAVARSIWDLNKIQRLPRLQGAGDFKDLPSFFAPDPAFSDVGLVSGPSGANIVYAVATTEEIQLISNADNSRYKSQRKHWQPFTDAAGATIEMATKEGLNRAGQNEAEYRDWDLPQNLIGKLKEAKTANSPVVIVLDRTSLKIKAIKDRLAPYDDFDSRHVGLVVAGGCNDDEHLVGSIFPTKFGERRQLHMWTVPQGRDDFIGNVFEVISGLRRALQQDAKPTAVMASTPLPGL
ncbi:MAG: toll/interleukin-1 receptor domain-containing protein [Acetobacteraceae bacterium]|nr:toll/interleukin-1 receptor domain-containing protein [Acetobacteraceae bacterium]